MIIINPFGLSLFIPVRPKSKVSHILRGYVCVPKHKASNSIWDFHSKICNLVHNWAHNGANQPCQEVVDGYIINEYINQSMMPARPQTSEYRHALYPFSFYGCHTSKTSSFCEGYLSKGGNPKLFWSTMRSSKQNQRY